MEVNKVFLGDCVELSKNLKGGSVDLVVTSPPYADTLSYGENVKTYSSDEYIRWFLPLFIEAEKFLKNTGSFILNINDKIKNSERELFVYKLVLEICEKTNLKLYDRYIWHKKSTLPRPGDKRLNDMVEYIFHFVKDAKKFKCNTDDVREPYKDISLKRFQNKVHGNSIVKKNGETILSDRGSSKPHPKGKKPTTVFRFNTASAIRGGVKHPAPFHPDLPRWFIKWLTDRNDLVLDPFMGSGSVAVACEELKRKWIGFDINPTYIKMTKWRLKTKNGKDLKNTKNRKLL